MGLLPPWLSVAAAAKSLQSCPTLYNPRDGSPPGYSFWCNCRWNCFLTSLSDSSLLEYRKTTDVCILVLLPATLLNSFINSNRFLVKTSGFYHLQVVAFLFFPLHFWCFYFHRLLAVARTSNICQIEMMRVIFLALFLIFEGKFSVFHWQVWCYLWVCHKWPSLCFQLCWKLFYHKWVLHFVKSFFWSIEMIVIFIICFVNVAYHID